MATKRKYGGSQGSSTKRFKSSGAASTSGFRKRKISQQSSKYHQSTGSAPEQKYTDVTISGSLSQAGIADALNLTAQGVDNTGRIGRKITIKHVQYMLTAAALPADLAAVGNFPEATDTIRVSLVYDKQTNGVAPTYGQVYNVGGANTPFGARNLDYIDRFSVLSTDNVIICQSGPNAAFINRFVKCDLETRYDGTTAVIGSVESGGLFLVYADINAAGTTPATLNGLVRCQWTDV